MAPHSTRHAPRGSWRGVAFLVGMAFLVCTTGGCSMWPKRPVVPESVATCRQLARQGCLAIDQGQWDQAEQLLRQAIDANENDHEARRQYAEVLWQRGVTGEAVRQAEFAERLAPDNARLAVRVGEMHLALGKHQPAIAYANQAITVQPELATAWALRGRAHTGAGDLPQGLSDLHRALSYAPSEDNVLLDIAEIYHRRGEPERCLTSVHHILDLHPPGEEPQQALYLEGVALAELGRHADAVQSLYAATRRGPPRADILYHLAEAELHGGRTDAARAAARNALAVDARHGPTLALFARLDASPAPTVRR